MALSKKKQSELTNEIEKIKKLEAVFIGDPTYDEMVKAATRSSNPLANLEGDEDVKFDCGDEVQHYLRKQKVGDNEEVVRSFVLGNLFVNGEDQGIKSVSLNPTKVLQLKTGQKNVLELTRADVQGTMRTFVNAVNP